MLDRSPFLQFTAPRLAKLLAKLPDLTWSIEPEPLPVRQTRPTREHRPIADADGLEYTPVDATPHYWGQLFDQCFWRLDLRGRDVAGKHLLWRDQGEATVYREGMPLFGFDPGHPYQPLPAGAEGLTVESMCSRSGIWVTGEAQGTDPRGSRFDGAHLATRDEHLWSLWMDFEVLLDVAFGLIRRDTAADRPGSMAGYRAPFDTAEPLAKRILAGLDRAADALDRGDRAGAAAASGALVDELRGRGDAGVTAILTGHAHIDLVWLWPEAAGEFKAVHSFANALSLMERDGSFVFGYSQPASYDAVDRRAPKLMDAVARRVAEGRFEHAGATYVECDTQLPCGEALLRCFELGQADLERRFGERSEVLWVPDVFGYSPCLPQVMRAAGVKYFYTTKLHWSSATQFPYSSFRWRGHDGSEVLTHLSFHGYNETAHPTNLRATATHHRQAGVHREALAPTGYGDGGGGTNEAMLERARRCADLAGVPRAQWGRIDAFFRRMEAIADDLPVHRGEGYLEYHRGVQTTGVELKAAFRAAERGLQAWEAAHAVLALGPVDTRPWKRLTFAHFHDHIPGSSIKRVYDEGIPELARIADDARAATRDALSRSTGGAPDAAGEACLFNPLALPVRHRTDAGVVELPPLAGVAVASLTPDAAEVHASPTELRNGRVAAAFNARGEVARLAVDGHELAIAPGRALAEAWAFPDTPIQYDAWDIERHSLANGDHEAAAPAAAPDVAAAPGTASVAFTRTLSDGSTLATRYTLDAGSTVLRIDLDVDWVTPERLLKLAFPTDYQGHAARYATPFGSILRPQHPGPLPSEARFENPASRWVALADDTEREGIMVVTRSTYGFGCTEGLLHASILRSPRYTQPNVAGAINALEIGPTAEHWDLGRRHVALALGRFTADAPRGEQPAALADTLFTEPVAYAGRPIPGPALQLTGGDSLIPAWVKPTDDGPLLRLHETLGRRGTTRVATAHGEPQAVDFRPYQLLAAKVSMQSG